MNGESDLQPHSKRRKVISRLEQTQDELSQSTIRKTIKTCGRIQEINLKNVLCHANLNVKLNENTTLIQGANGSGKSSIVAAIIAGFGGSASMADKGKTFKNLIQHGKNTATIEIHLNNDGVNSFKRDEYGDVIICERKIPQSGSGTYRLLNENRKVISTKKDDMKRMLQRFNIQVDNPVVVLSQERAKSFLASTTPRNLFKFFMLSTGIQQISDDYAAVQKNLSNSQMMVNWKIENLNDLRKDLKVWERKCKNIKALEGKKEKVAKLKQEVAIAEYCELKEELRVLEFNHGTKANKLEKIKEKLKKLDDTKKRVEDEKKTLEGDSEEIVLRLNNVKSHSDTIEKQVAQLRRQEREIKSEITNIQEDCKQKKSDITSLQDTLASDNNSAHQKWAELMNEINHRKQTVKNEMKELKGRLDVEKTHSMNFDVINEKKLLLSNAEHDIRALSYRRKELEQDLYSIKQNQNNSLSVLGQSMPLVVSEIEKKSHTFRNKPVGPIFAYINCKDQNWTHIAELVLKPLLSTFIVSCKSDLDILKRILADRRVQSNIIITKFRDKLHDVSRFEVKSNRYNSLFSILDISNIHVANAIIDQLQVEAILLIPTPAEAGALLKDQNNVPINCKKAYTLNGDIYFPDPNFRVYSGDGRKKATYLQVSPKDRINDLQVSLQQTVEEIRRSESEVKQLTEEVKQFQNEYETNQRKKRQLTAEMLNKEKELRDLVDREEPPPQDMEQLQNELRSNEEAYDSLQSKLIELNDSLKNVKSELVSSETERKSIATEQATYMDQVSEMHEKIVTNDIHRKKINLEITGEKDRKKQLENEINNDYSKLIDEKTKQIEVMTARLTVNNEQITETKRKTADVQRELLALQNAIQEEESKTGDLETVLAKVEEKSKLYLGRKEEITEQEQFIKKLKSSLDEREVFLNTMRNFTAMYLDSAFSTAVQGRDMKGEIVVEYDKKELHINVSTSKAKNCEEPKMQSLTMMSGGEKSFSTVSFILALWDIIKSPIRVLDEFDVFMDNISRGQVVRMMMTSIKPNIQYMFISPLENENFAKYKCSIITLKPPRE